MKNNNGNVISNFSKKKYKADIKKNLLTIFAIIITTFMLTSIVNIGVSYWNSTTKRSIALEGMKYDVELPEPTPKQVELASRMDEIAYAGLTVKCAIINVANDKSVEQVRMFWSDETNWLKQVIPALEIVKGEYPQNENEVILSLKLLKKIGIDNPKIGMEIPLSYTELSENGESKTKNMILSGYYRDYSINSSAYVSETFYKQTGAKQTDLTQGSLKISLKNPLYSSKVMKKMEKNFKVSNNQRLFYDPYLLDNFLKMAFGLGILLLLVLASGYLFIHNILYISVVKDVRFYGQLKTIGMSSKQIGKIIKRHVVFNLIVGVPIGLLAGGITAFILMPFILRVASPNIVSSTKIYFNPLIFIAAAIFSILTVLISVRKPIKLASNISPIEASRFTISSIKKSNKVSENGAKIHNMAWRNIFRNRRQATIIFISFFIAITSFLVINTIVERNSAINILNKFYDYDLRVLNQTITEDNPQAEITEEDVTVIENIKGVKRVEKIYSTQIVVPYNDKVLGEYFKELFELPIALGDYETELKKYINEPENVMSRGNLLGIDEVTFDKINKTLDNKIDKNDFFNGDVVIMKSAFNLSLEQPLGKELLFKLLDGSTYNAVIGDISKSSGPNYFAAGLAPDVIISQKFYNKIVTDPKIELLSITYDNTFNNKIEKKVKNIFSENINITTESKMSSYNEMKVTEKQMSLLGTGLGIIIALLAILNYCNMIVASIQNRTKEMAVLQSIGMSTKQIKNMLIYEGLIYSTISYILVIILGIPISYILYGSFNSYKIPFSIPFLPNLIVFLIIFLICIFAPLIAFKFSKKDNLVEQIKTEE